MNLYTIEGAIHHGSAKTERVVDPGGRRFLFGDRVAETRVLRPHPARAPVSPHVVGGGRGVTPTEARALHVIFLMGEQSESARVRPGAWRSRCTSPFRHVAGLEDAVREGLCRPRSRRRGLPRGRRALDGAGRVLAERVDAEFSAARASSSSTWASIACAR